MDSGRRRTELHHHGGVGGRGDAARREVDDGEAADLGGLLHQLERRLREGGGEGGGEWRRGVRWGGEWSVAVGVYEGLGLGFLGLD